MAHPSISALFPQLANLIARNPNLFSGATGGQNFTHCCLVAINQSLSATGSGGSLSLNTPAYFHPPVAIDQLKDVFSGDQAFPCGTSQNVDGSLGVRVPYDWCLSQCGGWEMSQLDMPRQWAGPLVHFMLPCLALCLSIPRASRLAMPDVMSQSRSWSLVWFATFWIRMLWAGLLAAVDTVVWLFVCFAFAGPMLLSAMYEYVLDRRVLNFLDSSRGNSKGQSDGSIISSRLRAQLLLAVAVGNLRISTGRRISIISQWDAETNQRRLSVGEILKDNTWSRVMAMIDEDESDVAWLGGKILLSVKLKAVSNSRASFGATIGAPVLFFLGEFIYIVLSIRNQSLQDKDTARGLAFGMWWMTIPLLAIISGAMLASPNPSALQGIVWDGGAIASRERSERASWDHMKSKVEGFAMGRWIMKKTEGFEAIQPMYDGQFKVVTLWSRGPNKRRWVEEAIRDYSKRCEEHGEQLMASAAVRRRLKMDLGDYINITTGSALLLIIPSLLAFLISYHTPRKGISCYSGTYLVYAVAQIMECLFWGWEVRLKVMYGERWSEARTRVKSIEWCGQTFVGFLAIFTTVAGTLLQLLGVYRTCACKVPFSYWLQPEAPGAYIDLSATGSATTKEAQQWWTASGIVAVGFVFAVCVFAWWHQHRLRMVFNAEANSVDEGRFAPQLTLEESYESMSKEWGSPTAAVHISRDN